VYPLCRGTPPPSAIPKNRNQSGLSRGNIWSVSSFYNISVTVQNRTHAHMNFFCLESHILSFLKVLQIPPESPCMLCSILITDTALIRQWLCTLRAGESTILLKLKIIINFCIQHVHTLPLKYYTLRHIYRPIQCVTIKHHVYTKKKTHY
jgi:hypothetical protein